MCVTRFDQSECVISRVIFALGKSRFQRWTDEIVALFQARVGNFDTIPPWKVVGTLYLDGSYVTFKYFAFLNVCDKFELLGHLQVAMMIWVLFSPFFLDSCWILLALLSDYFGHLVTSTFFLCTFRVLTGSTPISFPVMRRWKCLGMAEFILETNYLSQTDHSSLV